MPYLMLDFTATRDMQDDYTQDGKIISRPSGREEISFRMIDTDTGKVVELSADCTKVEQKEREPNWGETHAASQTLGKGVGEQIDKRAFDEMKNERDSYRQKALSADKQISERQRMIAKMSDKIEDLKQRVISDDDATLIGSIFDDALADIALNGKYEDYERGKKIFKRMTGTSWDGSDDDNQEEDPEPLPEPEDSSLTKTFDFDGITSNHLSAKMLEEFFDRLKNPPPPPPKGLYQILDDVPKGLGKTRQDTLYELAKMQQAIEKLGRSQKKTKNSLDDAIKGFESKGYRDTFAQERLKQYYRKQMKKGF